MSRLSKCLVLAFAALLALVSAAPASVRLGPDLTNVQDGLGYGCQAGTYSPCSYVNLRSTNPTVPVAAPFAGVITKWRFRGGCCEEKQTESKTMTLKSYQQGASDGLSGYGYFVPVNTGPSFVIPPGSQVLSQNPVELPARMPIAAGERIGIVADNPIAFASYNAANTVLSIAANGITYMGQQYGVAYGGALAINAELEPDADHDGYGDETQDCQPTDPTQHEACVLPVLPAPPIPAPVFIPGGKCSGSCGGGVSISIPPSQGVPTPRGDGGVVIQLACPAGATSPCGGIFYAELPPPKKPRALAAAAKVQAPKLLGKLKYTVKPGAKKKLTLVFTKKTLDFLALKPTRRVTLTLKPNSGSAVTKTVTLHFKPKHAKS